MWQTILFTSLANMRRWQDKNRGRVQWIEIFINNGYGLEYRKLHKVY